MLISILFVEKLNVRQDKSYEASLYELPVVTKESKTT